MLAIILMAGTSFYALWCGDMRSKFYRLPVLYVTWIYAAVQIAAGFLPHHAGRQTRGGVLLLFLLALIYLVIIFIPEPDKKPPTRE
jgi:hypothetical protein